jgi:hypothetical protein
MQGEEGKAIELTEGEARVFWSILAGGLESEEARMRSSGVPRTTYRVAKQRLYAEKLLEDRYLPNPLAIGVPRVSFLLTRPPAESVRSVGEEVAAIPGAVGVWSGVQVVLAVVFHDSVEASNSFLKNMASGRMGIPYTVISVDTYSQQALMSQVPVYFDFEGAWTHFCGFNSSKMYPRPLPGPSSGFNSDRAPPARTPPPIASLIERPFSQEQESRPPHLVGPSSVPWSQKRCLRKGEVEWRTFPSFSQLYLLEYNGLRIHDVLFVTGRLKDPGGLQELFQDLVRTDVCNAKPFLLAGDEKSVLMAGLGIEIESVRGSAPDVIPRRNILQTMTSHLESIEVCREPVALLKTHVAHRYDRLLRGIENDGHA